MLKALLITLFITGYSCREYTESDFEYYEQLMNGGDVSFPELGGTSNTGVQDFKVQLIKNDIVLLPEDRNKALSFKTKTGTLTVTEVKISESSSESSDENSNESSNESSKRSLDWIVRLDSDEEDSKPLYVTLDAYSHPEETTDQEHAKTHAIYLEPLTKKDVESLRAQPDKKNKSIQLDVQWAVDLLNNERKPLFFGNMLEFGTIFASPPVVMNGDVIKQVLLLMDEMENS